MTVTAVLICSSRLIASTVRLDFTSVVMHGIPTLAPLSLLGQRPLRRSNLQMAHRCWPKLMTLVCKLRTPFPLSWLLFYSEGSCRFSVAKLVERKVEAELAELYRHCIVKKESRDRHRAILPRVFAYDMSMWLNSTRVVTLTQSF